MAARRKEGCHEIFLHVLSRLQIKDSLTMTSTWQPHARGSGREPVLKPALSLNTFGGLPYLDSSVLTSDNLGIYICDESCASLSRCHLYTYTLFIAQKLQTRRCVDGYPEKSVKYYDSTGYF